jgi:hypothetical protein
MNNARCVRVNAMYGPTFLRKILRKILRSHEALPILRSYVLRTIQGFH